MNKKNGKLYVAGFFAFFLVVLAVGFGVSLSSDNAVGSGIRLILNSPVDGDNYILGQEVLFDAQVISISSDPISVSVYISSQADGQEYAFNLERNNEGHYVGLFNPPVAGAYKISVNAQSGFGHDGTDLIIHVVEENPPSPFSLIINSPLEGSEWELGDSILLSAGILSSSNLDSYTVWANVECEGGFEGSFNLSQDSSLSNYEAYFSPVDSGVCKAIFYAENSHGDIESAETKFLVKDDVNPVSFGVVILSPENGSVFEMSTEIPFKVGILESSTNGSDYFVWAFVECSDGTSQNLNFSFDGRYYISSFSPVSPGSCKAEVYAKNLEGDVRSEDATFFIEDSSSVELNLDIISPEDGEEFDKEDTVDLRVKVLNSPSLEVSVYAKIINPEGVESIVNLVNYAGVFEGEFSDTSSEGIYSVTFYARDELGNTGEKSIDFEVVERNGGSGGGSSGGDGNSQTRYYFCIDWSDWSTCVNGIQNRTCMGEIMTLLYRDGASLDSQLWTVQERSCFGNSGDNSDNNQFGSWITGLVAGSFGLGGLVILIVLFILILILAIIILLISRRRF